MIICFNSVTHGLVKRDQLAIRQECWEPLCRFGRLHGQQRPCVLEDLLQVCIIRPLGPKDPGESLSHLLGRGLSPHQTASSGSGRTYVAPCVYPEGVPAKPHERR